MIHRHSPGSTRRLTLGADKGYDSADFVAGLRQACVTPHVAQKLRHSAIDARTIRHAGHALSQKRRKKNRGALRLGRYHRQHGLDGAARDRTGPLPLHVDHGCLQSRQIAPPTGRVIGGQVQPANSERQIRSVSDRPGRETVLSNRLLQQPVKSNASPGASCVTSIRRTDPRSPLNTCAASPKSTRACLGHRDSGFP